MAHIIGNIAVMPRIVNRTNLSCMNGIKQTFCQKNIHDTEGIQKRINEAAKVKTRLEADVKKRYENIKHINFLG